MACNPLCSRQREVDPKELRAGGVSSPTNLHLTAASGQVEDVLSSMTKPVSGSPRSGHKGPHLPNMRVLDKTAVRASWRVRP